MNRIDRLYMEMIHYYQGDPKHIQHFVKVHDLSRLIGQSEGLDEDTMYVLEAAALVHDIGIKVGMEKYGRSDGKTQEAEGPAAAREMLTALGFQERVIRRVEYLVGHHQGYGSVHFYRGSCDQGGKCGRSSCTGTYGRYCALL